VKLIISAKCSDLCFAEVIDAEGNTVFENNGYVPPLKFIGGGDYVRFTVDLLTGQIQNWKPITDEELAEAFENV